MSGPLGIGAMVLKRTPEGLSLNSAPPSDAVVTQFEDQAWDSRCRWSICGTGCWECLIRDRRSIQTRMTRIVACPVVAGSAGPSTSIATCPSTAMCCRHTW